MKTNDKWLEIGKQFKKKPKKVSTSTRISNTQHPSQHLSQNSPKISNTKSNQNLIPILLPEKLVASARQKLTTERGINLENFLQIYLRMILRASKGILGLKDELPFGKYSGEILEEVVRIDPNYVLWLITQDGRTKFEPEVLILVNEMIKL